MKTLILLDATLATEYALEKLPDGVSSLERVVRTARAVADPADILVLGRDESAVPGLKTLAVPAATEAALVEALIQAGRNHDLIVHAYVDAPFWNANLTKRMLKCHVEYFAEYSFADGYPAGVAPEIVSTKALPALAKLAKPLAPTREGLFALIQRDINSFDVETELSPVDLRMARATLFTDTRRSLLQCARLAQRQPKDEADLLRVVKEEATLHRTLPAFYQVQLMGGCPQSCSYCPFPLFGGDILGNRDAMPFDRLSRLVAAIADFSDDAVVNVSLWGEPSLYPWMAELARDIAATRRLKLLVETSGIGWTLDKVEAIVAAAADRVEWIVSLDSLDPAVYEGLRGVGFAEALAFAHTMVDRFPGRVYVQAVRMLPNEDHLESFFRTWKEKTDKLIIQKYDHFAGLLPQRKVADLSPLHRIPCWHLRRDMAILLDGTVTLCREDVHRAHVLGSAFTEPLDLIWERGEAHHRNHCAGDYLEICKGCDEYYTYNF